MQAMQRVVILFVGILSVVRATPFDLDNVDRPTPFQYKVESGNGAFSEGSEQEDNYEIGTLERSENFNFVNESDKGKSMQSITDLFRDVQFCDLFELKNHPKEGCAYVANGNVYFINVLSAIYIEDVYVAFGDAGIEECEVGEDGLNNVPEKGCFWINEDIESVYWIGAYDADEYYQSDVIDDIEVAFDNIEECDLTSEKIPREGCSLFDENGIHLINVLNELSVDDFEIIVSKIDISECIFDKEQGLINKDPCYWVNLDINSIHFLNLHRKPEGVQDNDDDDSKETPGTEAIPPSVVKTATGNVNPQQIKLKGHFSHLSSFAKETKVVLPKKIQSRKQPQEVQQKLGRRGHL